MDQGGKFIPFLLHFYGQCGEDEEAHQLGEGGEQGDPLMLPVRQGSTPGFSSSARKFATNRDVDGQ